MPTVVTLALMSWAVLSPLTFLVYAWDKRAARRDLRRVPERTLLSLDLAGGWPGGALAQTTLRHKTRKLSYRIKFVAAAAINLGLWVIAWRLSSGQ